MRTTRGQVDSLFRTLTEKLGERVATSWDDHGAWQLDYAACYGGYQIQRIDDETSGVSLPFGEARHPAGAMWDMLRFAIWAVDLAGRELPAARFSG